MKPQFHYGFIILLLTAASCFGQTKDSYDFDKKYPVDQLKADFTFFRNVLEQKHPRLYEYTPKNAFDNFMDSLYGSISGPMTEREFQYFLLPVIGKVHCSHTKLMSSQYLLGHPGAYFRAPPFKLIFTDKKVFLQDNYSGNISIKPGAEIFAVNNISVGEIRRSFLSRIPSEGLNETFMYNRINTAIWPNNGFFGLFPGLCDYPVADTYQVSFKNPGSNIKKQVKLSAMAYKDYPPLIASDHKKDYSFYILDSRQTAVLTVSSFLHSGAPDFEDFIDSVFTVLSAGRFRNLIIDVRGNIGGIPETSVALLSHIMRTEFIYFSQGNGYDDLKVPVPLAKNRFAGKVFFLADGGCRSTTGHFLAMVKYYKLGPITGEESCGSWSCNDNGAQHTLPNTQLILNCSESTYSVAVSGMKRGRGIMPDYTVKPTIDDLISGKDPVLQFVLSKIKAGKGR